MDFVFYCFKLIDVCVCSDLNIFNVLDNVLNIKACTFQELNQCVFDNLTNEISDVFPSPLVDCHATADGNVYNYLDVLII
jgi:hypothetical protein